MEQKRDLRLDYVKGFAMLLIVIGHMYYYLDRYEGSLVWNICNTIHIPVFMYISGLLAHVSIDRYGFRKLIGNRAIRLLLPFMSYYVIWCLIDYHYFIDFPLKEFKKGFWFMLVLFELMITLSLVMRLAWKYRIPSWMINGLVYGAVTLYLFVVPRGNMFNILFCINLYWHYYPFFMFGYYFYKFVRFMQFKYAPLYLVLYIVSFYFYFYQNMKIFVPLCNLFSLLFFVSMFIEGSRRPMEKVFAKLGFESLQIYMIHLLLIYHLKSFIPIVENLWLEIGYYLLWSAVLIVVSMGIARVLEKSEWLNLFLFGNRRKKIE